MQSNEKAPIGEACCTKEGFVRWGGLMLIPHPRTPSNKRTCRKDSLLMEQSKSNVDVMNKDESSQQVLGGRSAMSAHSTALTGKTAEEHKRDRVVDFIPQAVGDGMQQCRKVSP